MGDNDSTPLTGEQMRDFLRGQFSVWFATRDGRSKANADDKKRAAIVADQATDTFVYYAAQREAKIAA